MLLEVMGMIKKNLDKDERLNRTSRIINTSITQILEFWVQECLNYKFEFNQ